MSHKHEQSQIIGIRQTMEVDHTVYVSAPQTVVTDPSVYYSVTRQTVQPYQGPQIVSAPLKPEGEPVMVYVRAPQEVEADPPRTGRRRPIEPLDPNTPITVRRHWDDYRKGVVPFRAVTGWHYSYASGGIGRASPHPMLSGYIMCDALISGEVAHSCAHGPGPHSIKVVACKVDNTRAAVKEMVSFAEG